MQGIKLQSEYKIQQDPEKPDTFLVKRGGTGIESGSRFNKYDKNAAQRILQMYGGVSQEDRRQDYEAPNIDAWNNAQNVPMTNFVSEKGEQITGKGTSEKPFSKPPKERSEYKTGKYYTNVDGFPADEVKKWNGKNWIN